ncbi:MAG: hypothetical protein OHK0029_24940 [Armatimonadaceae bacterium]
MRCCIMKIYPQNLRDKHHFELVRKRTYGTAGGHNSSTPSAPLPTDPRLGFWGKQWAKGLDMNERQAAVGNAAASRTTAGMIAVSLVFLMPLLLPMLLGIERGKLDPFLTISIATAVIGSLTTFAYTWLAPHFFHKLHAPVQEGEVQTLMQNSTDELEREYLALVRDATLLEVPETSEQSVRDAIESLGEAIDRLPAVVARPLDTEALRQELETLHQQVLAEPDRVVSESLERRARALESRLDSHERSAILARRAAALHAELMAQIEALRGAMMAYQTSGLDTGELGRLSSSARQVAFESTAVANAQAELEAPVVVQSRSAG